MDRRTAHRSKSVKSGKTPSHANARRSSSFPTRGRAAAELTALVGAQVVGEHRHPALVERFTVLEGELTVKRAGQTTVLYEGETAVIEAGVWHDWWNASNRKARVRVEVTPGERFSHMVETLFGLARLGHTDNNRPLA
jgi:quercetin dioxygenase-like cupin family protein